jgi:gliding motility-associated lipoprotein GldD
MTFQKMKLIFQILIMLSLMTLLGSCREKPVPKPSGYYRIGFQEKKYHLMLPGYPYRFELADYATIIPDSSAHTEPYWMNVEIPAHKAEIHISYKTIRNNLFIFTEESRKLAYDHTLKASSIEEDIFLNPSKKVFGTIYHINGNAASPMQFYMTDSARHFLRGALYIRATPNIDSLKPVIDFLKTDVIRLIRTLEWTKQQ